MTADGGRVQKTRQMTKTILIVDDDELVVLDSPDVGQYTFTDKDVLRCPWHHFEFDLETGKSIADPDTYRVRVFKTRVEGDSVIVER